MTYLKKFLKEPAHTFHNEYDDEYYINEIIGIDEITYEKPRAEHYIDDRAIEFNPKTGAENWKNIKAKLL